MFHSEIGRSRADMTPSKYAEVALTLVARNLIKRGHFTDKKQFMELWCLPLRDMIVKHKTNGDNLHFTLTDPGRSWDDGADPMTEWAAVATAYAIESIVAEHDGQQSLAWTYAVDAMFAANASRGDDLADAALQDARSARARNAGNASAESRREDTAKRNDGLVQEARKLLTEGKVERDLIRVLGARHLGELSAKQIRRILQQKGVIGK